MAQFNQSTQKSMGMASQAVASGKKVSDGAAMLTSDGSRLSGAGAEHLAAVLIGKALQGREEAVRHLLDVPTMRNNVLMALGEIAKNRTLPDDYTLIDELARAIDLCYRAKRSNLNGDGKDPFPEGTAVSLFAKQRAMDFDAEDPYEAGDPAGEVVLLLADLLNDKSTARLRKVLADYYEQARRAADGQLDAFTGERDSREKILTELNDFYNNATRKEQLRRQREIMEQRRSRAPQGDAQPQPGGTGKAGTPSAGGGREPVAGGAKTNTPDDAQRQSDLAKAEELNAPLSETEINEFGKPFVLAQDGTTIFGFVDEESGLTAAPIKLNLGENQVDREGHNHGYGLLHIDAAHGEQIRQAGYATIEELVESVSRHYTTIREGGKIAGNQTYLLEVSDEHNNTLFIQLSRDGSYWNINSAGIFKTRYSRNKKEVFNRPALGPDSSAEVSGVNHGQTKDAAVTSRSDNSPQTSEDKVTKSPQEKQAEPPKSSDSEATTRFTLEQLARAGEIAAKYTGDDLVRELQREMDLNRGAARKLAEALRNMPGNAQAEKPEPSAEKVKPQATAPAEPTPDKPVQGGGGYTIEPTPYTNKKGKITDCFLVKFDRELTKAESDALKEYCKEPLSAGGKTGKGWYDRVKGGWMMRSEEAAKGLADIITDQSGEARLDAEEKLLKQREGREFGHSAELEQAREKVEKLDALMRQELKEKEAKYAEMDKDVQEADAHEAAGDDEEQLPESGKDQGVRFRMGEGYDYERYPVGRVEPGLKDASVEVVRLVGHGFETGSSKEVGEWIDKNLRGPIKGTENLGEFYFGNRSKQKVLQMIGAAKAEMKDAYLSSLKSLGEIISNSIDAETHPDFNKEEGVRAAGNGYDRNNVIHRFYGAVSFEGKTYRVKTTVKENLSGSNPAVPHSFELQKLELLPADRSGEPESSGGPASPLSAERSSISAAKLLKDVEMSYNKGVKILEESGREDERRMAQEEAVPDEPQKRQVNAVDDAQVERLNRRLEKRMDTDPGHMAGKGAELARKLNTPIRIITDPEEIAGMSRRRRHAKGWYDTETGEVVVIVGNHDNVADVESTVFHEVVAHKGLRKLVGEEHYDDFLDEVYDHADAKIKEAIDEKVSQEEARDYESGLSGGGVLGAAEARAGNEAKRRQRRRAATDEYFAEMAEKVTEEGFEALDQKELGFWKKAKELLLRLLRRLKLPKSVKLHDKDLLYMLWRSYKNLKGDGGVIEEAQNTVMRDNAGFTNEAEGTLLRKMSEREEVADVNRKFNEDLQRQVDGTLPARHIYELGMPGRILRAAGFPDAPIEMSATRLAQKAAQRNHQFDLGDIRNLPSAINRPVGVFAYGDKSKAENVIVGIDREGKQFVVGVHFDQQRHGSVVSDVRGIFNKDNAEWLNWISQGKAQYLDKEKIQALIEQQRTNLAEVQYLDLDDVAKVITSFENPTLGEEESSRYRFRDTGLGLDETITRETIRLSKHHEGNLKLCNAAYKAIGGNLTGLRRAMAAQRKFDVATVKSVTDLAQTLMESGMLNEVTPGEVKRLLSVAKNSVGRTDLTEQTQKIFDILVNSQLREGNKALKRLLSIRDKKVNAMSVEVQEGAMRDQIKAAGKELDAGNMERDAYDQFVRTTEDAIRQSRIDRADNAPLTVDDLRETQGSGQSHGTRPRGLMWRNCRRASRTRGCATARARATTTSDTQWGAWSRG